MLKLNNLRYSLKSEIIKGRFVNNKHNVIRNKIKKRVFKYNRRYFSTNFIIVIQLLNFLFIMAKI